MKFNLKPWQLTIDENPDGELSDGGQAAPDPRIAELEKELASYKGIVEKLRPVERRFKSLEALLGTTDPEKLQELREADRRIADQQSEWETKLAAVRDETASEYKPQISKLEQQNKSLVSEHQSIKDEYELFQAFNESDGIGSRFRSFVNLGRQYFYRSQSGALQVKDIRGETIYIDGDNGSRPATPTEFMKLLASNKLPDKYAIDQKDMLQITFNAYNKAQGANLPTNSGQQFSKPVSEMSQSELGSVLFGGA